MNKNKRWPYDSSGIDDHLFIRGEVPMTKSEVRAVTVNKLKLVAGQKFLDIGAGTGSVSIEAGVKGCQVTAVERHEKGVALIRENGEVFGIEPFQVIHGKAPEALPNERFDRVFIGGTGGNIPGIFAYLKTHLNQGAVVVANTITIENTSKFMLAFKENGYRNIEAVQVNVSRSKAVGPVHMMMAENPITIISAIKAELKEIK